MPKKPAPTTYLDMPAVAARLDVTESTIRKYRSQGRLPEPDIMLGQSPGWRATTIDAWIKARPGRGVGGGRPRKDGAPAAGARPAPKPIRTRAAR